MRSWIRAAAAVLLAVAVGLAAAAPAAHADGDPGSDVLVFQDLFAGSDAGLSVQQQLRLGAMLKAAARQGFPVRVAIIAGPADLGAVTALWHNPRGYARFLGIELSAAYTGRLLVVMPDGLSFNWPGHSTRSAYNVLAGIPVGARAAGLFAATTAAVTKLAAASGIRLPATPSAQSAAVAPAGAGSTGAASAPGRSGGAVALVGIVVLAVLAAAGMLLAVRWALRRPRQRPLRSAVSRHPRPPPGRLAMVAGAVVAVAAIAAVIIRIGLPAPAQSQGQALASNPYLDPGTTLSGKAPDFTLSDQFGQPVALHSFRGKVVMLAFNDSECTTVCPLTTTAMLDAKAMLGKAGSQVQLLGIDANPAAISLEDVWSYSELHGMQRAWRFLTGSLPQLKRVWRQYAVEAAVERGQISHTPALFVIDPNGRKAKVYITQMSYTAIGQLGQLLAREASSLLPGHPPVHSDRSYVRIPSTAPSDRVAIPRAGGGRVELGPGRSARLFVFFATWDRETSGLAGQLDALNRYQAVATREGLPRLTAVDEASVEPSSDALTGFLRRLPAPLSYPVAIDRSGTLADGYQVLGVPWFVLVSPSGRLLYYREVSTAGWPSTSTLVRYVRAALASAPKPTGPGAAAGLAGSPAPLAALHSQAGALLGGEPALAARLKALHGYPVVINAWASWCGPCRSEFGLFASASARYGHQVAFLGADTSDSSSDARAFLSQHPVSYPSYQTTTGNLSWLAQIAGLPTTVFMNRAGKVVYVHTGQYDVQGTLDQDVRSYALGG